jgi:WD40 repeat protein
MKYSFCIAFVALLFVSYLQAQETPGLIEVRFKNNGMCSAVFSPDGTKIVTARKDNTAQIWDAETGKKLLDMQHEDSVSYAVFSPDGKKIATSGYEKCIPRTWDVETGKELHKWEARPLFFPDGKRILAANKDRTIVSIFDAETGRELQKLQGHTGTLRYRFFSSGGNEMVHFSSDGKRVVTVSTGDKRIVGVNEAGQNLTVEDVYIRIWDTESGSANFGKELLKMDDCINYPDTVAFSPDGKRLIIWVRMGKSEENFMRILDTESGSANFGKELLKLKGHTESINTVSFSPDGKKIITTSRDETARIWDVETGSANFGKEILQLKGEKIIEADRAEKKRKDDEGALPHGFWGRWKDVPTDLFGSAVFSLDGKKVLTTGGDKIARVWDAETGEELHALWEREGIGILHASFSPDGKKVVTHACSLTFRIWDLEQLQPPRVPKIEDF